MSARSGPTAASGLPIGSIDLPMPGKLRRRYAAVLPARNACSNATGETYASAECSRLRL